MLGYFVVLARNCLPSTLDYIVMQMRKTNCEKGYWHEPLRMFILHDIHVACMLLMNLFAVVVKTLCLVPR